MSTALWEVESAHLDAIASIDHALHLISDIFAEMDDRGADDRSPAPDWPALGEYARNLEAAKKLLVAAMPDEINQAIKEEQEKLDHLSDLADGTSY